MTDELTAEQRKRVAEAVTGNDHRISYAGFVVAFRADYWRPRNKLWQWKALVRWIADRNLRDGFAAAATMDFHRAISNNTDALERMVLEILEET